MKVLSLRLVVALILLVVGIAAFVIGRQYEFGTALRMGPGFFPLILSGILVVLALSEVVLSVVKPEEVIAAVDWRAFVMILSAIAGFGLAASTLGLIPAFFVVVGLATRAEPRYGHRAALLLTVGGCAGAWFIFSFLLGMTIPLFKFGF